MVLSASPASERLYSGGNSTCSMKQVWAVKHRPSGLSDFMGQDHLRPEFEAILSGDAPMQHYIFHSVEPGTGKTSLAYILAEVLGYSIQKYNASSKRQRGIEFVENDLAPMTRLGQYETIFFLDEADQLTDAAQSALKGVIEDAQGFFVLTCNDLSKVSPWLQSRCSVRTFKPLSTEQVQERLAHVARSEGVQYDPEHLSLIANAHKGDLRNAINAMQAYYSLPEAERGRFVTGLGDEGVDARRILTLCFKEGAVEDAVREMGTGDLRGAIDVVFRYGVASKAESSSKLVLVEAATQAQRDLIAGVPPHYVVWDFCRALSKA
jgi:DNA polymerase III delta prime subunit